MQKKICKIFIFLSLWPHLGLADADTNKPIIEVRYKGPFTVGLDRENFIYESKYFSRKVEINSCNKDLIHKIFKRLDGTERKKRQLIPIHPSILPPRENVEFERNGRIVKTKFGSGTHKFLENLPKSIDAYVSLMRQKCK